MPKADYKFFFPFRVRYAETDAQGIVFNGNYLTYTDTAIYEYFRSLSFNFVEYVNQTGADKPGHPRIFCFRPGIRLF